MNTEPGDAAVATDNATHISRCYTQLVGDVIAVDLLSNGNRSRIGNQIFDYISQ